MKSAESVLSSSTIAGVVNCKLANFPSHCWASGWEATTYFRDVRWLVGCMKPATLIGRMQGWRGSWRLSREAVIQIIRKHDSRCPVNRGSKPGSSSLLQSSLFISATSTHFHRPETLDGNTGPLISNNTSFGVLKFNQEPLGNRFSPSLTSSKGSLLLPRTWTKCQSVLEWKISCWVTWPGNRTGKPSGVSSRRQSSPSWMTASSAVDRSAGWETTAPPKLPRISSRMAYKTHIGAATPCARHQPASPALTADLPSTSLLNHFVRHLVGKPSLLDDDSPKALIVPFF